MKGKRFVALVFCNIAGQHDNLGDVILRRRLLDVLRPLGQLQVLAPGTTPAYRAPLLDGTEQVYDTPAAWREALGGAMGRERVILAARPGELVLKGRKLARSLVDARLVARVSQNSGYTLMAGIGLRHSPTRLQRLAMRIAFAPYRLIGWRDVRTTRDVGFGELMPDWAFGYGDPSSGDARDTMVVSLRSDRPMPSAAWFAAARAFADGAGCGIRVVTQVRRDLDRSRQLAAELGGTVEPWNDDYVALEDGLRRLYRRTRLALSDRLHVLIVAATEGAVPLCLAEHAEQKIERHFAAIGFAGVAPAVDGRAADHLRAQAGRAAEIVDRCAAARTAIEALEHRIRDVAR